MMDCKNALDKAEGDFDKAERLLKEQGLAAAVKKSDRVTNSGRIFSRILPDKGILLELTSETDFVSTQQPLPGARKQAPRQGRGAVPHPLHRTSSTSW